MQDINESLLFQKGFWIFIFTIVAIAWLLLYLFPVSAPPPQDAETTTAIENAERKDGNVTVESFSYLYDASTNLCLVYNVGRPGIPE